jgi:TolB-like protein/DNA-binding winged helix-turn-helix (wHTH) protein/Tfp pilus assembly protein PilF
VNEVDPKIYKFGPFHVDLEQRLLFRGDAPISLTQKAFDTLAILVARQGKVVDKSELIKLVWPETFVEENNLTQNISTLRKALGEGEYIETIPRRGYRFVMVAEDPVPAVSALRADSEPIQSHSVRRMPRWIWGVFAIAAIVGLAYFTSMYFRHRRSAEHPMDSLVVLPFMNLSANPDNEYFSDGLTEEITNVLAHIEGLRVIARTSAFQFKGKALDIRAIGRQLHVGAVLEGSVRRERNRLRVTAQLNDAEGGFHIWSQTYDKDEGDTFKIQEDISRQIAHKVRPNGSSLPVVAGSTNLEAYNLYLKGRYYWNKGGADHLKTAMDYLQKAIAKDPGFALAWSSLADCYASASDGIAPPRDALSKARATAERALALDRNLGEAYVPLARVKVQYDWDWAGAERDFRQALQLNPGYATAHQKYGQYLAAMGRFDEAFAELKRAQELDPVSLHVQANLGRVYRWSRQYDKALEQLHAAFAMDSNYAYPHLYAGLAYMFQSKFPEAAGEFQIMLKLEGAHYPWALAYLGYTYALWGKRAEAEGLVEQLTELSKHGYLPAGAMAEIYVGLGDKGRAFHWLAKAVDERDTDVVMLKVDPLFDPIRSDPRFADLLRRVNFGP